MWGHPRPRVPSREMAKGLPGLGETAYSRLHNNTQSVKLRNMPRAEWIRLFWTADPVGGIPSASQIKLLQRIVYTSRFSTGNQVIVKISTISVRQNRSISFLAAGRGGGIPILLPHAHLDPPAIIMTGRVITK